MDKPISQSEGRKKGVIFLNTMQQTRKNVIPFKMLEMVRAHQIPSSPRAVDPSAMASGILADVRRILIMEL